MPENVTVTVETPAGQSIPATPQSPPAATTVETAPPVPPVPITGEKQQTPAGLAVEANPPKQYVPESEEAAAKDKSDVPQEHRRKGRPPKNKDEKGERFTALIPRKVLDRLRDVAYWERMESVTALVVEALDDVFKKYHADLDKPYLIEVNGKKQRVDA